MYLLLHFFKYKKLEIEYLSVRYFTIRKYWFVMEITKIFELLKKPLKKRKVRNHG